MSRFDEAFLALLRERTDIAELVGEYLRLEKRGGRYWGLCPFHVEKTPSFTLLPDRQIYYCFGCKATGDAFRFLMEKDRLSFGEAVEALARRAGVPLPEPERTPAQERVENQRRELWRVLEVAARFFEHQLHQSAAGALARAYVGRRRIAAETARRFRLGCASDSWDGLLKALNGRFSPELLLKAGLVAPRDGGGHYDRFRNRLMFPICDLRGRVLAFGGRALAEGQSPKYYNSPEGTVYSKRQHLYALHLAKEAMRAADRAVLVEGYMDALALHQAGFAETAASLGTSLTPEQVALLRRQASRVYIAYDADTAGAQATLRGLELLPRAGCQALVVRIPQGKDPDELVREGGTEAFQAALDAALPLIEFKLTLALSAAPAQGHSAEAKAAAAAAVLPALAEIADAVRQAAYLRQVAETLAIPEEGLRLELRRYLRVQQEKGAPEYNQSRNWNNIKVLGTTAPLPAAWQRAERMLLQRVISDPAWAAPVVANLGEEPFADPVHATVWFTLREVQGTDGQGVSHLVAQAMSVLSDGPARTLVAELAVQKLPIGEPQQEVRDCIRTIQRYRLEQRLQTLQQQLGEASRTGADAERPLQQEIRETVARLRELTDRAHR